MQMAASVIIRGVAGGSKLGARVVKAGHGFKRVDVERGLSEFLSREYNQGALDVLQRFARGENRTILR